MVSTRILLVEDDAFLREIYVDTLTREGFTVMSAGDGNEGMQKIKEGNWDLLLLDIILPQMDGLEIMRQLRADPALTETLKKPVVFLTNLDNDNEMKQALQLGNGYLIKSKINPGELVTEVKKHLENPV